MGKKDRLFYFFIILLGALAFFLSTVFFSRLRSAEAATETSFNSSLTLSDLPPLSAFEEKMGVTLTADNCLIVSLDGARRFHVFYFDGAPFSYTLDYGYRMGSSTFQVSFSPMPRDYAFYFFDDGTLSLSTVSSSGIDGFSIYLDSGSTLTDGYIFGITPSSMPAGVSCTPVLTYPSASVFDPEMGLIRSCIGYRTVVSRVAGNKYVTYRFGFDFAYGVSHTIVNELRLILDARFPSYALVGYLKNKGYTPQNVNVADIRKILSDQRNFSDYMVRVTSDIVTSDFGHSMSFNEFNLSSSSGVILTYPMLLTNDFASVIYSGLSEEQIAEYQEWFVPFFSAIVFVDCYFQPFNSNIFSRSSYVEFYDSFDFNEDRKDFQLFGNYFALCRGLYTSMNSYVDTDWTSSEVLEAINNKIQQTTHDFDAFIRDSQVLQNELSGDSLFVSFSSLANGLKSASNGVKALAVACSNIFAFLPAEIYSLVLFTFVALLFIAIYKGLKS